MPDAEDYAGRAEPTESYYCWQEGEFKRQSTGDAIDPLLVVDLNAACVSKASALRRFFAIWPSPLETGG